MWRFRHADRETRDTWKNLCGELIDGWQILELPIGDPHQVRTDFAADVVAADDHEDLEGLARNIACR